MPSEIEIRQEPSKPAGALSCFLRGLLWIAVLIVAMLFLGFMSGKCSSKSGLSQKPLTAEEKQKAYEAEQRHNAGLYNTWFAQTLRPMYKVITVDDVPGITARIADVDIPEMELARRIVRKFWRSPAYEPFRPKPWREFYEEELRPLAELWTQRDALVFKMGQAELDRIAGLPPAPGVDRPSRLPTGQEVFAKWFKQFKATKKIEIFAGGDTAAVVDGRPITSRELQTREILMDQMSKQRVIVQSIVDGNLYQNLPALGTDAFRAIALGEAIDEILVAEAVKERGIVLDKGKAVRLLSLLLQQANGVYLLDIGDRNDLKSQALNNLVNDILVEKGAELMQVTAPEKDIDAEYKKRIEVMGGEKELKKYLHDFWSSEDDLRTTIKRQLLQEKLKIAVPLFKKGHSFTDIAGELSSGATPDTGTR